MAAGPELPAQLASSDAAAAGWRAQTEGRGMRLVLPEGRIASAIEANRRYLLLFHEADDVVEPSVLRALALYGFDAERAEVLEQIPRRRRRSFESPFDSTAVPSLERLAWFVGFASPTFTWTDLDTGNGHDARLAVEFLTLARNLLVRDVDGGLALCPTLPEPWAGRDLEVHDAPTALGLLSFAVRWHGGRPALLWDLRPHDGTHVTITAPGLDPAWSTTESKGEALLEAPTRF